MNENIDLCKLLVGHEGEEFYSPTYGNVIFSRIDYTSDSDEYPIIIEHVEGVSYLTRDGRVYSQGEKMLFPSRDQRDWEKWKEEQGDNTETPKTWSEICRNTKKEINLGVNLKLTYDDWDETISGTAIEKSALALLKIHQLIEIGYGGNVGVISYNTAGITPSLNIITAEKYKEDFRIFRPLLFRNEKLAKTFLSYPENVQLIKDYSII